MIPLRRRNLAALLGAAAALPGTARGQGFPARPLRIVVPFPPGGSTDLLARRLAERLSASLGQTVVVENRPGAGGTTGSDLVAKSAPDGHTLLMGVTGTNAIAPALFPALPYDPRRSFAPIARLVSAPLVLVRHPGLPGATLAEFIAAARARPETITYATPGNGTSMHLTGVMFDQAAGTRLVHVPYRGSGPAVNDLIAGQVATMFGDFLVVLPHLRAGTIRAIAVTSRTRHPLLPDVPSMEEAGLPGFEALSWQGLFAPAGTPEAVVALLHRHVAQAMESPEIRDFFAAQGFLVGASTPADFAALVEAEVPRWAAVVRAGGVKLD
jgi:tripartite-type tricarboxylate transporter receptor subunit TctC